MVGFEIWKPWKLGKVEVMLFSSQKVIGSLEPCPEPCHLQILIVWVHSGAAINSVWPTALGTWAKKINKPVICRPQLEFRRSPFPMAVAPVTCISHTSGSPGCFIKHVIFVNLCYERAIGLANGFQMDPSWSTHLRCCPSQPVLSVASPVGDQWQGQT